jgi:hypothetical protein
MKTGYGQFCPVAVASEIFAERWTPIILRELVLGSHEVDLFVDADLAAFSRVWLGEVPIRQVIREGGIRLAGARDAVRDFPSWLLLSTPAAVPRPAESNQRRVA